MDKEQLLDYYIIDETSYDNKVIEYVESIVRNSRLYKKYIGFIRENYYVEDRLFIDYEQEPLIKELHHVICLYDLCMAVLSKQIKENGCTTIFKIVDEVLYLHVNDFIPVVMLAVTTHNLYHSGQYEIPKQDIHIGEYTKFIKSYGKYLPSLKFYTDYSILNEDQLNKLLDPTESLETGESNEENTES